MGLEERTQEREINGVNYSVTPLPFGVGRKTLMRLVKIISPIAAAAFRGDNAGVFEALPLALTDDDVEYFAKIFGQQSRYLEDGNWKPLLPANQEMHFAGRYAEFVKWLVFSIEVNFGGFFSGKSGEGLADLLKVIQAKAA